MHHYAITTRYLSPTNNRGARVKAFADDRSLTFAWDHALSPQGNHAAAAQAMATQMNWKGAWFSGLLPRSKGDVFVRGDTAAPAFTV
jgi:hypothetical protein